MCGEGGCHHGNSDDDRVDLQLKPKSTFCKKGKLSPWPCSPAHDFMCEENSAHFWVLVLSLIGYGLKGGIKQQESIKLLPLWLRGLESSPTCFVTESMSRA